MVSRLLPIIKERCSGNMEIGRKQGTWQNAAILLGLPPATSLILPGTTCLVIVLPPPPVNWVMLRQLAIKKIPTETYPKANLTQATL